MKTLFKYNLNDKFTKIITRDDVKYLKPNPEGFGKIHDPIMPLEKYLLIGDSYSDEKAAEAAKIDFYKINFFDTFFDKID